MTMIVSILVCPALSTNQFAGLLEIIAALLEYLCIILIFFSFVSFSSGVLVKLLLIKDGCSFD